MADFLEYVKLETTPKLLALIKKDLDASAIDTETQALNFSPITGVDAFDFVYGDKARKLQGGFAVSSKWMNRLYKVEDFQGWFCNGRIRHLCGSPFRNRDGSAIRYMSAADTEASITFIKPSPRAIELTEARFNIPKPIGWDYWHWIKTYFLPVVITEGEKKAAALICAGIPAISLPGIFTGFKAIRDDWGKTVDRLLREELKDFDVPGRTVYIMFDRRPDQDFEATVEFRASAILSRQFKKATVKICNLPGPHKGADDYLAAGAIADIEKALIQSRSAQSMEQTRMWREYRHFDEKGRKTRNRFFTALEPQANSITVVKSNLNSGKSQWFGDVVSQVKPVNCNGKVVNKAQADGVMVSIGHRNSLQEQLCERWDFDHLDIHSVYGRFSDPSLRVALCFDSLLKLPTEIFDGATVVIDETMTAIKHLLTSSTLRGKRLDIITRFEYIVRVCNRLILMDGNMSDWMVDYVTAIDPNKAIDLYDNTSDRPTPPIFFVDDNTITKKKAEEWLNLQILESALPAIVVDSIIKAEAIALQLTKLKGEGILITSKTVTEKWVRTFLKSPDDYITANPDRVNWITCTPTVESGVSIENVSKFDTLFCWFVGVVGINEAVQMSRRVRNPGRIVVYAPKVGIDHKRNAGAFEQVLMEDLAVRITAEAGLFPESTIGDKVMATLRAQLDSPHVQAWAKMQAISYLETRNYREFLYLAFESMGMTPQRVEAYEIDSEVYRNAKLEVQIIECTQIFNAPDLTDSEAEAIGKKIDSTWAERCSVLKYKILYRFPGLRESPLWTIDFVHRSRYVERDLTSSLEMFWLLTHRDESKALQAQKWLGKEDIDFFIPDRIGDRWAIIEVLNRLGFTKLLADGHRYSDQSENVLNLIGKIRSHKTVSRITGHPGDATNLHFINRILMPMFGIKPVRRQVRLPVHTTGVEGARVNFYYYDRAQSHTANFEELIQYVDRRFQLKLGIDPAQLPEIQHSISPNLDGERISAFSGDGILPQTETKDFEGDQELQRHTMAGVKDSAIYIQIKDNNLTPTENYPVIGQNGGESGETVTESSIGAIEALGSDGGEDSHKLQSEDFLTVWVRTNALDRPKIEPATLLDCEGEGFSVTIEGLLWTIAADDLFWQPPEPS
jgi:hypothetical protein